MSTWTSVAGWTVLILACTWASSPGQASAALIITGVVDGDEEGGTPKAIELYATADESDLSIYSIGRYTNGGSQLTSQTELVGSLMQGEFYYITGPDSDTLLADAGLAVDLSNKNVANINGDDVLRIVSTSDSAVALDTFGRPGQGDKDFYADSIAYRIDGQAEGDPSGSIDAAANFTIDPWTGTDQLAGTFGSFQAAAVPEPSSVAALSALAGLGVVGARRRQRRQCRQRRDD